MWRDLIFSSPKGFPLVRMTKLGRNLSKSETSSENNKQHFIKQYTCHNTIYHLDYRRKIQC